MPSEEHAVHAELCETGAAGRYLAKLGLELTGAFSKRAAGRSFTHWQLARAVADGEQWAAPLWREHSAAMLGARQLTWSPGLRARLGLQPERPDECIAAETLPEPAAVDTLLCEIAAPDWDLCARQQRQLWLAYLHDAYADGTLPTDPATPACSRVVRDAAEPAPVWWHRLPRAELARASGAATMRRQSDALAVAEERRGRAYLSKAERLEIAEELSHHLRFEHGLAPPE